MNSFKDNVQELVGINLSEEQLSLFSIYQEELADWNTRINLTAIKDPEQVRQVLFLDSFSCLLAMPGLSDQRVVDVGSGAGFPGIPLKLVFPDIQLTLIESRGKKAQFLEHIVEKLGLNNVEVLSERVEKVGQMTEHREQYDWVVARAVAKMPVLVEYMLPLVKVGGKAVSQKGDGIDEEVASAKNAIDVLGGKMEDTITYEIDGIENQRSLVVVSKVKKTNDKYPRHDGTPAKKPL